MGFEHISDVDVPQVFYAHANEARLRQWQSVNQTLTDVQTQRSKLGAGTYGLLRQCMLGVRARVTLDDRRFATGCSVLVIGWPSWDERRGTVKVCASRMFVDDGRSRDLELAFRMNVAAMYAQRYRLGDV